MPARPYRVLNVVLAALVPLLMAAGARASVGIGPGGSESASPPDDLADETAIMFPAGDLDADGGEDAIERRGRSGDLRISAVRGTDGDDLWRVQPADPTSVIPMGDLDGVPGDDLILVSVRTDFLYPTPERQVTSFTAVRGKDGTQLWTKLYAGSSAVWGLGQSINVPSTRSIADADGDEASDLLLAVPARALFVGPTSFELISGSTGSVIAAFPGVGAMSGAEALMVPDLTGDGLDDVAVLSWIWNDQAGEHGDLAVYPGLGGPPVWRLALEGTRPEIEAFHLDGDGVGDLFLETLRWEEETAAITTEWVALSGEDGRSLWHLETPESGWSWPAGDADGDGGEEVVLATDSGSGTDRITLVGGRDGQPLWERTHDDDGWPRPVGDTTGDGVVDVMLELRAGPNALLVSEMVSGATGETMWTRSTRFDPLEGDLDGDGLPDLIGMVPPGLSYVPVSGASGQDLWPNPIDASDVDRIEVALLAEGPAILESGEDAGGYYTAARSGSDGTVLWKRAPGGGN